RERNERASEASRGRSSGGAMIALQFLTSEADHVPFRAAFALRLTRFLRRTGSHFAGKRYEARFMHRYRTHTCGELRAGDIGKEARLSGWCHRIRDHGGVLFIDLRDHYGVTQVVADPDSPAFKVAETLRSEWVVRIDGKVRRRPAGTENPELPTGAVE